MNVLDLIKGKGIEPKKAANTNGGEYHSPCPVCGGNDRFCIWPNQNNGAGSYWCRQCRISGDTIQFLMDFEKLSFKEAAKVVGREIDQNKCFLPPSRKNKKADAVFVPIEYPTPVDTWKEKTERFVKWSHEKLLSNQNQLSWLSKRGINVDTVEHFRLGWNPGDNGKDIFRYRESWGLPTEIKDNGKKKRLWIPRGLVIPYFINDSIYRIKIRLPEEFNNKDQWPRYYVLPGSGMAPMIFGSNKQYFIVVESELDGILIEEKAGDLCGIVILGSSSAKPDKHIYTILKKSKRLLYVPDADRAGIKSFQWWQKQFATLTPWPVPVGKDPGEAFECGVDIRKWIVAGLTDFRRSENEKRQKKAKEILRCL